MTKEEAQITLAYHSFMHDEVAHPKMEKGFLGMLRPFQGELYEENFHEVMAGIKVLADDLSHGDRVDRKSMAALWAICDLTRAWAIDPAGMLQTNQLISAEQIRKLDDWISAISYAMMMLLGGSDIDTALELYHSLDSGE